MSRIEIEKSKLDIIKLRCIQEEKRNDKTKARNNIDMAEVIRKIIIEEVSKKI